MTIKEFKTQLALGSLSLDDLEKLAYNPKTSKGILILLSNLSKEEESWEIQEQLACNPSTPAEVLTELSSTEGMFNMAIVESIAGNTSTPIETLNRLAALPVQPYDEREPDCDPDMFIVVRENAETTLKETINDHC